MHIKKFILAASVFLAFNSFAFGQQNETYGRFVYAIQNTNNFNITVSVNMTANPWNYSEGWISRNGNGNIGTSQSGTINGAGYTLNMNGLYGFNLSGSKTLSIYNYSINNAQINDNSSRGSAIYSSNSIVNLANVTFDNNRAGSSNNGSRISYGGVIYAQNGSVIRGSGTVTFSNSYAYSNTSAYNINFEAKGGAIHLNNSELEFLDGASVTFSGNYAHTGGTNGSVTRETMGGAIYANNGSVINFGNSDFINFTNNYVKGGNGSGQATSGKDFWGGAIYLSNASFNSENTNLTALGNYVIADYNHNARGGFLYADGSSVIFGSATISGNYVTNSSAGSKQGGAIFAAGGSTITFTGSYIGFINNYANQGEGGAIYLDGSTATFTSDNIVFNRNYSTTGGAMYITGSTVSFTGESLEFSSNTAGSGAAIFGANSKITFESENTYFYNNVSSDDNGIIKIGSNMILDFANTNITATGNKANSGGFLYLSGNNLIFNNNVTLENNETNNLSGHGGSLYLSADSSLNFNGQMNIFKANKVTGSGSGGAFYINGSNAAFSGVLTQFEGNNVTASNVGGGGALYISGSSSVSFNSSDTEFTGNFATGPNRSGGAIYLDGNASLSFGKLKADSNTTGGGGGFLYANAGSDVTFNGSVEFSTNTANQGGAIFLTGNRNISFTGEVSEFKYNSATAGGALYLTGASGSSLTFNTVLTATDNKATNSGGGFLYVQASSVNFLNNVSMKSNTASGAGGAIYASNANLMFSGNSEFSNNISSGTGGAVYAMASSFFDFTDTSLKAESNIAKSGGFMLLNGSTANFGDIEMNANRAISTGGGGALAMLSSAVANFNGLLTSFNENYSSGSGGAAFAENSSIKFNGYTKFHENESGSYGGAVYLNNGSTLTFSALSSGSEFVGNKAELNGGAVALRGGSSAEFYNAVFKDNKSLSGLGGAVSIEGASPFSVSSAVFISQNVSGSSITLFSGNTASGLSNAVYLGNFSNTHFIAEAGSSIEMRDSMSAGSGNNINMYFAGEGDFNLYADALLGDADVKFSGSGGGTFNLYNGANFTAKKLTNDAGSVIRMNSDNKNTITLSEFVNNGELEMTAALSADEDNTESDQILVSGDVALGGESVLKITLKHSRFIEKEFKLIRYGGDLDGEFGEIIFDERAALSTATFSYGDRTDDWITVLMQGKGKGTNFAERSGLSKNQHATAVTYDALSLISQDDSDLDYVITELDSLNNNDKVKDALDQACGYFLANVIRSAAFGGESNEVYNRIQDASRYALANSGLWAQAKANSVKNKADENSPEDYKDTIIGMMMGYDRYFSQNSLMLGVYGKFDMHNIKQGPGNKADITSLGLGVYGGYIKEKWELKALLSGNFDSYNTEREITFLPSQDRKAKADFGGTALGFDLEGAYKIDVNDDIQFRPYAGIEVKSVSYDEIKEKGAQSLNLTVDSGSYGRMAAKFGAGVNRKHNVYGWYINGEYKQLLDGELPEIENTFEGTDEKFKIVGSEEGQGELGVKAGGSYSIAANFIVYADVNYFTAERYNNFYGNLGVRWLVSGVKGEKTKNIEQKKDAAVPFAKKRAIRQGNIEEAEYALIYDKAKLKDMQENLVEKKRLEKDVQEEAKIAVQAARDAELYFYSSAGLTAQERTFEEKNFKEKLKKEKDAVKAFNNAEKEVKRAERDIEKQSEKVKKAEADIALLRNQAQEKETVIYDSAAEKEVERELKRLQKEEDRIKKEEMKLAELQIKKAADEEKKRQKQIAAEAGSISGTGKDKTNAEKEQAAREKAAMKELAKAEKQLLKEEKMIEKERAKIRKEEERLIALQVKMLEEDAGKKEQTVKAEAEQKRSEPVQPAAEEKTKEQKKIEAEIAAYEASLAAAKVKGGQRASKEASAKKKEEEEKKRKEQERIQKAKATAKEHSAELSDAALEKRAKEAAARRFKKVRKAFDLKFTPNNYKLVETAKITIREQAAEIKQTDYRKIIIEGHTDSEEAGSYEGNKTLSRKRAKAVYDEFVANGIPKDKIDFAGLADKFPISDNKTDRGKIDNRRVEIVVE